MKNCDNHRLDTDGEDWPAIDWNEVGLSKRFASLGDSDMAWIHRRLAESIAAYLGLWK